LRTNDIQFIILKKIVQRFLEGSTLRQSLHMNGFILGGIWRFHGEFQSPWTMRDWWESISNSSHITLTLWLCVVFFPTLSYSIYFCVPKNHHFFNVIRLLRTMEGWEHMGRKTPPLDNGRITSCYILSPYSLVGLAHWTIT
jgi:hypothetical protein